MTSAHGDRPPTLARRRFLVTGLGAVLAACAGTAERSTLASRSAPTTSPSAPDGTPSPDPTASATTSPTTSPDPLAAGTTPSQSATPTATPPPEYPTGIVPTRIRIPALGVDAPVVELQLTATEAEVPEDFDAAGWWVQTREPGEIGPAVIGGHVDSTSGPAVFYRLQDLRAGDEVTVTDDAGDTRSFVVSEQPIRVRKDERPPEVFGFGEGRPELRLITCGGDFDPTVGHYVDNVVAFAHQADFSF